MNMERKRKIAFALSMGVVTTGIISFTLIAVNVGFAGHFTLTWLRSWAMAYALVVPAILVIGPKLQAVVNRVIDGQEAVVVKPSAAG